MAPLARKAADRLRAEPWVFVAPSVAIDLPLKALA
jgi:hypothetical protein